MECFVLFGQYFNICIVMPEFYKGPEHIDFDIRAWEIKENELSPKNGGEIQNKSTTFEVHLDKQSID